MRIVQGLEQVPYRPSGPIVSIGAYDGMHLGHQRILREVVQRARQKKAASVVLSFSPHPQKVVSPGDAPALLQTPAQKKAILARLEVDYLVEMPFTLRLSRFSPEEFVSRILMLCRPGEIHVGWNFRFGYKRSGDLTALERMGQQHGFRIFSVPPVSVRGTRISSSKIRRLLSEGRASRAARLLGRPYQIIGKVVKGDGRGRQLGFPTANLDSPNELIPANGVYACRFRLGKGWHACLSNVGLRPTVHPDFQGRPVVESHLLDFEQDIYGRAVELEFLARMRAEKQFDGLPALVQQIQKDVAQARRYLKRTRAALFGKEKACPSAEIKL